MKFLCKTRQYISGIRYLLIYIFLFIPILPLNSQNTLFFTENFKSARLNDYSEFYEDAGNKLTYDDISARDFENKFKPLSDYYSNFGYSSSTFWLRIKIPNIRATKSHPMRVLQFKFPQIHYIDFYQVYNDQIINEMFTGTMRPVDSRIYPDENFVFFIVVPAGQEHILYFRIQSEAPVDLSTTLSSMDVYHKNRFLNLLFNGIFIGFILLASAYLTFIFFQLKDKSYLFLSFTGIFLLLYNISFNGMGYLYIWPQLTEFNRDIIPLSVALLMIFFILFVKDFLNLQQFRSRRFYFYRVIIAFFILNAAIFTFIDYSLADQLNGIFIIITFFSLIPASYYSYRNGHKPSKFFFIGVIIVFFAALNTILTEFGIIPYNITSENGIQFAAIIAFWFWSHALAQRIGLIRSEKEIALDNLQKSEEQLAMVLKGSNLGTWDWNLKSGKIKHNDRWAQMLGYSLEKLNPDKNTWYRLVHPDDRDQVENQLDLHIKGKTPIYEVEYRLRHKSGEWIWIQDRGRIVEKDNKNKPVRFTGTHADITKLKQAEIEKEKSEDRYHSLFNTAADSIFIMKDDIFIDCNEQTLKMFNCTKAQIIGKPPYLFSPKMQPDGTRSKLKALEKINAALNGKPQFFEWQHARYDGSVFNAEVSLNLVSFSDGDYIQAIVRDISTRKRTEHLLNILNEAASVMQKSLTTKEILTKVSKTLEKYDLYFTYFPYNKEKNILYPGNLNFKKSLIQKTEQLAGMKVNDLRISSDANQQIHDAITKHEVILIEEQDKFLKSVLPKPIKKLSKQIVQILKIPNFILAPLLSENNVEGLISVQSNELSETDIPAIKVFVHQLAGALKRAELYEKAQNEVKTRLIAEEALLESESRLQSILSVAPVGIGIIQNKKIVWFNKKLTELTFYNENELIGRDSRILFPDDAEYHRVWENFYASINLNSTAETECLWRRKDEKIINVIFSIAPINKKNKSYGVTFTVLEITDRIILEEQVRQSQKMEAIGQLAGGVAHDFNNILTVISGYCNLMINNEEPYELYKEKLKEIQKAAVRAEGLTRQLLAFSRKQIAQPVVININTIINDSHKMLRRLLDEDIKIKLQLKENIDSIHADPHQIEQILVNLMVNARDAILEEKSGQNLKQITIQTNNFKGNIKPEDNELSEISDEKVILQVSDTGKGMNEETKKRIFEPFFTTKGKDKGTGLGLSTVYGIVRQNKGQIIVDSEIGKGTTFNIYWPAYSIKDRKSAKPDRDNIIYKGNEKILLVEDDFSVRNFTEQALKNMGYQVISTENGEKALEILESDPEKPDLVITDMIMPGLNGLELSKRIKKFYPQIKILFTSGYTDDKIAHEGFLEKDINFIQKPFSVKDFSSKIRDILKKQNK